MANSSRDVDLDAFLERILENYRVRSENATGEDRSRSLLSTTESLTSLTSNFKKLQIGQNDYSDENDEKSVTDKTIIQEALNNSYANLWLRTPNQPYALVPVAEGSIEYFHVVCEFSSTSRGMSITKLERVENPYLLAAYLLKKEKMREEGLSVRELTLFHGTRRMYIDNICKYNFDWRRSGTSRGHKFGRGVSFAREVSYARHYTFGNNVMILAKVLVANSTFGNTFTVVPPESYDTTQNVKGTVVVKYEDNDFFPQYVIHYSY